MINTLEDLRFSTDMRVVTFSMASNLSKMNGLDNKDLHEIITLCYKIAKSINFIEACYHKYKLNKLIMSLCKLRFDEEFYDDYTKKEIDNFITVMAVYRRELNTGHFPFRILSCKNHHVTMIIDSNIFNV